MTEWTDIELAVVEEILENIDDTEKCIYLMFTLPKESRTKIRNHLKKEPEKRMSCQCGSRKFSLSLANEQREFEAVVKVNCYVCGRLFKTLIDEHPLG